VIQRVGMRLADTIAYSERILCVVSPVSFCCSRLDGGNMSIYEAIGMAWVIFTSAIATVGILYLAYIGFKTLVTKYYEGRLGEVPVEVKEMFKIAR
jgi:hypothetical protein